MKTSTRSATAEASNRASSSTGPVSVENTLAHLAGHVCNSEIPGNYTGMTWTTHSQAAIVIETCVSKAL